MTTAQLLWGVLFGSIGFGYFLYGKKQRAIAPFLCGLPSSTLCRPPTQPNPIRIKDLAWFAADFCSLNP